MRQDSLLTIKNLRTCFHTYEGVLTAVDGIGLEVYRGETLGVVGESGCGKSVTALSILRLLASPPAEIQGEILFDGKNLLNMSLDEIRQIRGNSISMIFQEPMTSLNPVLTIGEQISEAIKLHQGVTHQEAWSKAVEMLRIVQIPSPEIRAREYPHKLSGGMRQRAMIAMALSCHPRLLLADEPTTALDVTIQAQIVDLMERLKEEIKTSVLLITHNLGLIAEMAKRVVVMYAGKVVEEALVEDLFAEPLHPYTQGLLGSIPWMGRKMKAGRKQLQEIPGMVPSLLEMPEGCRFHPRCPRMMDICRKEEPPLVQKDGRRVLCWLWK
ncbi:MAG: ABC transporter ATP-binding protein [Deltaproteobacteria bacterium]|nr:ABC transporter ATP-binding protein [Deltaproteobacteria bacterium]